MACLSCSSLTSLERQLAALFWDSDIHLKVMLYVASSNPHLFTFYWDSFHLETLPVVGDHWIQ